MNETFRRLKERNKAHSAAFRKHAPTRTKHWANHPTWVYFLGCMDGRVNFLHICDMPAGAAKIFKQRGGVFTLAFNYFGLLISNFFHKAISHGQGMLGFVSYHYDETDAHLGYAGHKYDTDKAKAEAAKITDQLKRVFTSKSTADAVMVGIETNFGSLVFHGRNTQDVYHVSKNLDNTPEEVRAALRALYPDMDRNIFRDLAAYAIGNHNMLVQNDGDITEENNVDHNERIIAIGRGHDFIFQTTNEPGDEPHINSCLSVGTYNDLFADEIHTSFKVLLGNVTKRDMSTNDGFVVMVSAIYEDDVSRNWAIEKIDGYTNKLFDVISKKNDETIREASEVLFPHTIVVKVIINDETREMEVIESFPISELVKTGTELVGAEVEA